MAADVDAILRRHDQIKRKRTLLEQNWRECYDVTYPLRGAKLALGAGGSSALADADAAQSYARSQIAKIFDTTATDSTRILASSLVSGSTPASSRWFGLGIEGVDDEDGDTPDDESVFLDEAANTIWNDIHGSNFDPVAYECAIDEVIAGWHVMFIDSKETEDGGWDGYVFEQWSLAGTWATASKPACPLDTFHREVAMTVQQALNKYGEENCSTTLRGRAKAAPYDMVTIIQSVYPRDKADRVAGGRLARNLPFATCHIEKDTKKLVRESGYHECPITAPRWMLIPDSDYPVGPVFDALPDIKSLNKAVEMSFANMDLAIAGMWIAEDDGVMNPRTLKIGPRKVVIANSVDSMKPLVPAGKFDLAALEIQRLQRSIRKVLMADQLEPQEKGQRTATEVTVNVELIRQLLGPVFGRRQAEFMRPMVERCFGLALRAGRLGMPPDSLRGKNIKVKYSGPLARSQKMVDVAAMDRYETTLAQEAAAGHPEVWDNYDLDEAARTRADLLGVPARLIVKEDDRDARRQQKQQAAQQQQAMQTAAPIIQQAIKQGAPV